MSAIYNGRLVTVLSTERGQALIISTHNPRPTWVKVNFIKYIWGGTANVTKN